MPKKRFNNEEQRKYRSLNAYVVLFVFGIMLFAGGISVVLYHVLDSMGFIKQDKFYPLMSPLLLMCSCIILGSFLSALLSGLLLKPLNDLKNGMKKVAKGDFSVRLENNSTNSEIFDIQNNFNKMVQELENTELFRNDFINDFSHEFKTPMVSIYGFAKQLKKGGLTKEQEQEYIDIIAAESQRLIHLSGNILTLNRLENQDIISDKSEFELDEEIRRSILLLEEQWEKKDIAVIPELDAIKYYGNAEMLRQVFLNVIGNAVKYTEPGGEINITLTKNPQDNEEVLISVKDNGIGMDETTKSRMFEKFYQGDYSRATGGNGLGLAMVKRIIDLCFGRIEVDSQKGEGTDFRIYLPDIPSEEKEKEKKRLIASVNTAGLK